LAVVVRRVQDSRPDLRVVDPRAAVAGLPVAGPRVVAVGLLAVALQVAVVAQDARRASITPV
jgi:hypothetical protein